MTRTISIVAFQPIRERAILMKATPLIALAAALFTTEAAVAAQCRYPAAHYRTPAGDLGIEFVEFGKVPGQVSDLALRIRDERSGKDVAYYYFDEGSAPRITLISTTDVSKPSWRPNPDGGARPHGTATFIGMAADGRLEQTAPTSATPPARFVIIPQLGEVLKTLGISERRNDAFVLMSCGGANVASHPSPVGTGTKINLIFAPKPKGLDPAERAALIGKLQDVQKRLASGAFVPVELLSGAIASYPMTKVSPREAFLGLHFDRAFIIERVPAKNRLWQPYRFTIAPDGPGKPVWSIEAVLGFNDQVERVEMLFKPPPPF